MHYEIVHKVKANKFYIRMVGDSGTFSYINVEKGGKKFNYRHSLEDCKRDLEELFKIEKEEQELRVENIVYTTTNF